MLFMVENEKFVVQAVGEFDNTKQYPIGLFSQTGGSIEVAVSELENMPPNTKVYIYDSLLGTYTRINGNKKKFEMSLDAGDYLDRFYITFAKDNNNSLSVDDELLNQVIVNYLQNTKEIHIKTINGANVKQVYLTNMLGQTIKTWNISNTPSFSDDMKIPVSNVAEGSYIINVQTEIGATNKKIVISQ